MVGNEHGIAACVLTVGVLHFAGHLWEASATTLPTAWLAQLPL
jgi:hypothetical protein